MARAVTRSYTAVSAQRTPSRATVPSPPSLSRIGASAAPSSHFTRHHDVTAPQVDSTAFRQGWRVETRLDALFTAGRIDRDAYDAACMFRRLSEITAPAPAQQWDVRVDRSLVPNDMHALWRVNAASKLRAAQEALGSLRTRILHNVIVLDRSWGQLGRLLGLSDKAAKDWAIACIQALADFCAGRPVPPCPVIRYRNQPGRL
jgi:hypothetical protein